MSYTYLLELGEESSAESFLDIPQFVLSRLNLTAEKSYSKDNEMASCQSFQSGTMSAPSTELRGEGKLISSAVDFPVKTLAQLEGEKESKAEEVDCGLKWRESSVKFDPPSSSWKTHLCLWEEVLPESSVTLPTWGMMRDGVLWERITLPLLTSGTESGFTLPTPLSRDWKDSGDPVKVANSGRDISFPRYCAKEHGVIPKPPSYEWMMGWVIGWAGLKPVAMDKFQQWLHSHGKFSQNNPRV